ncbi:ETS homologous factor-like [Scylla paramamosain]|uniref:ETS homologous factor-like n=1 Tax=Scylla paramamosain TaxID=85552 RepID=UPI003083C77E
MECAGAGQNPLDPLTTPSRKRSRGPKSWEYVVRMLADERFNPSLISWVNKADFTFKFNKPADIARMWGQRANKPNLSYDNFARGLRYHYKTKALEPVSERQLVYKCGQPAIDFYYNITRH